MPPHSADYQHSFDQIRISPEELAQKATAPRFSSGWTRPAVLVTAFSGRREGSMVSIHRLGTFRGRVAAGVTGSALAAAGLVAVPSSSARPAQYSRSASVTAVQQRPPPVPD